MNRSARFATVALALVANCLAAQTAKPDQLLVGAAYDDEYMPYDRRLDKDVQLMKDAGLPMTSLRCPSMFR